MVALQPTFRQRDEKKMSTARAILFSAAMIPPVMGDLKTQTRRIVDFGSSKKAPLWARVKGGFDPDDINYTGPCSEHEGSHYFSPDECGMGDPADDACVRCLYGQPGDLLLVKENAWIWCRKERDGETKTGRAKYNFIPHGRHVIYQSEHKEKPTYRPAGAIADHDWRLKIGRYLPAWAVRTKLKIMSVRVERLLDVTEEDAKAEGVVSFFEQHPACGQDQHLTTSELVIDAPYRAAFAMLWDYLNGDRALWKSNPWVWVIVFKRVTS